jgi:hypothetical protein
MGCIPAAGNSARIRCSEIAIMSAMSLHAAAAALVEVLQHTHDMSKATSASGGSGAAPPLHTPGLSQPQEK